MSIAHCLLRTAKRYENMSNQNSQELLDSRRKFHIDQLKQALEYAQECFEIVEDDRINWETSRTEIYAVDEINNVWERVQLWYYKKVVDYHYAKAIKEAEIIESAKFIFETVLNRLIIIESM